MDPTEHFETARGTYVVSIRQDSSGQPMAIVSDHTGGTRCEFVGYSDRVWLQRAVREVTALLGQEGLL